MTTNYRSLKTAVDYEYGYMMKQGIGEEKSWRAKKDHPFDDHAKRTKLGQSNTSLNNPHSKFFHFESGSAKLVEAKNGYDKNDRKGEQSENDLTATQGTATNGEIFFKKKNKSYKDDTLGKSTMEDNTVTPSNGKKRHWIDGRNEKSQHSEQNLKRKKINEIINKYRKNMTILHGRTSSEDSVNCDGVNSKEDGCISHFGGTYNLRGSNHNHCVDADEATHLQGGENPRDGKKSQVCDKHNDESHQWDTLRSLQRGHKEMKESSTEDIAARPEGEGSVKWLKENISKKNSEPTKSGENGERSYMSRYPLLLEQRKKEYYYGSSENLINLKNYGISLGYKDGHGHGGAKSNSKLSSLLSERKKEVMEEEEPPIKLHAPNGADNLLSSVNLPKVYYSSEGEKQYSALDTHEGLSYGGRDLQKGKDSGDTIRGNTRLCDDDSTSNIYHAPIGEEKSNSLNFDKSAGIQGNLIKGATEVISTGKFSHFNKLFNQAAFTDDEKRIRERFEQVKQMEKTINFEEGVSSQKGKGEDKQNEGRKEAHHVGEPLGEAGNAAGRSEGGEGSLKGWKEATEEKTNVENKFGEYKIGEENSPLGGKEASGGTANKELTSKRETKLRYTFEVGETKLQGKKEEHEPDERKNSYLHQDDTNEYPREEKSISNFKDQGKYETVKANRPSEQHIHDRDKTSPWTGENKDRNLSLYDKIKYSVLSKGEKDPQLEKGEKVDNCHVEPISDYSRNGLSIEQSKKWDDLREKYLDLKRKHAIGSNGGKDLYALGKEKEKGARMSSQERDKLCNLWVEGKTNMGENLPSRNGVVPHLDQSLRKKAEQRSQKRAESEKAKGMTTNSRIHALSNDRTAGYRSNGLPTRSEGTENSIGNRSRNWEKEERACTEEPSHQAIIERLKSGKDKNLLSGDLRNKYVRSPSRQTNRGKSGEVEKGWKFSSTKVQKRGETQFEVFTTTGGKKKEKENSSHISMVNTNDTTHEQDKGGTHPSEDHILKKYRHFLGKSPPRRSPYVGANKVNGYPKELLHKSVVLKGKGKSNQPVNSLRGENNRSGEFALPTDLAKKKPPMWKGMLGDEFMQRMSKLNPQKKEKVNLGVKSKAKNPLFHSTNSQTDMHKKNIVENIPNDLHVSNIDSLEEIKKKYENVIKRVKENLSTDKNYSKLRPEGKRTNSNERIKENLDMIKEHFNKEKMKIDEENRMRHEINVKRKLYELKIRKDFEEKIRIRREMNERKVMEEGSNRQADNVNMGENHHKEDIHVDEAENGAREGRHGDAAKAKEAQQDKQKDETKPGKVEQKKNIFEDYSSDGSYYKYMYRNLYEETWNNKMKSHYHDVGDNFYLQDCSDHFFLNAKAHPSVADSLSNSFDNELISLSRIKFDDFDYNYLNEVNRSVLEKKETPHHSPGPSDEEEEMGRNPNLLKPKVILTDSEGSPRRKCAQGNTQTNGGGKNGSSFSDSSLIKRRVNCGGRKSPDCSRVLPNSSAYKQNDSENILNKLLLIKRQNRARAGEPREEVEPDDADDVGEADEEEEPDGETEAEGAIESDGETEVDEENKTSVDEVTLQNDLPEEENAHLAKKKQTRNKASCTNGNNMGGGNPTMQKNSSPGEEHSTEIKKSNLRETDVEKERKVNEWGDKNRHNNRHSNSLEKDQQNKLPNKSSGSDESENDENHLKRSLSSSDNGIPKINILNNRENYIPLDVALNFVIDNEKLKKTNVQKEHKGSQKKKTFVQWLMDERKKRLKNNLPIDI
ncbi:Uncharacterized protein PCOAH_00010490 [Plasmodium coatneyi]|uniref:Uncharacterized protein n=1 Tax=Plasmodium coatneyi TaxID=208452 RepID=A0A1B1DVV6_9APIC|nr:Uncharacterized protein PCOAH_00010490 [Plasmodium coatneyi]ANQ06779.1 Uncharacterized protein PCOAH_00010490 [Plasmodium coatneyi]